jgi:hypothetical protein
MRKSPLDHVATGLVLLLCAAAIVLMLSVAWQSRAGGVVYEGF